MYNLLIVDDEKEIREGLSVIPWHTMGVKLMGSAKHGLRSVAIYFGTPYRYSIDRYSDALYGWD